MSELELVALGDIQPGLKRRELFRGASELSNSADLVFCNLEGPVTKRNIPAAPKPALLRSDPFCIKQMVEAGVRVVSFANNHVMDFGLDAFLDTLTTLRKNGIAYCGAGRNLEGARHPVVLKVKGMRIAFLAYASFFDLGAQATDVKPGLVPVRVDPLYGAPHLNEEDITLMRQDILLAKSKADLVIVSHHWGISMSETLAVYQRSLAHFTIDAGADMVLGSHPHILQGIEVYKGKCVFYSLGNFIFEAFPPWFDTKTVETVLVSARISSGAVSSVEIHPMLRKDRVTPSLLDPRDAAFDSIRSYLDRCSSPLGTKLETEKGVIKLLGLG